MEYRDLLTDQQRKTLDCCCSAKVHAPHEYAQVLGKLSGAMWAYNDCGDYDASEVIRAYWEAVALDYTYDLPDLRYPE